MAEFVTVRSEGGLLPTDLLNRIANNEQDLGGLSAQDYGLPTGDRLSEAIARAWARIKTYWAAFRAATEGLAASESGVTESREQWLRPLMRELGYRGESLEVEFRGAAEVIGERRYAISHQSGQVPLHLVSFRQSLDRAEATTAGQRRGSPHALMQEYLNVSSALYGIISNGFVLRLLRDNASLTRQAYLEFDLEGMLEGGVYSDFVLLYLILHRSRLPKPQGEASSCWLEQWRERAEAQGTRAMGALRKGVEAAVVALGSGFLAHPENEVLRQRLRSGALTPLGYYEQLLSLIYRFIFLFAAEERDLIFPLGANPGNKRRYYEHYAAGRLRLLVRKYLTDDRYDDLWRGLQITFGLFSGDREAFDVAPLGGLFEREVCSDLDASALQNDALAEAIRQLSWVQVGKTFRRVNYRDMDTEELGGVYEGLLDWQPQIDLDGLTPSIRMVSSNQRKQTGSYYTPSPLVQELLRTALDPVIQDRLQGAHTQEERRRRLLSITVCDPTCGSGHFLLGAARRLADTLARIDHPNAEPTPPDLRSALREIIRHCIYGVDMNPLAVQLAKVALWLEGHDPGHPLSFLDHHVKLGNSLIGATWDLLEQGVPNDAFAPVTGDDKTVARAAAQRNRAEARRNTAERSQQASLFAQEREAAQVRFALAYEHIDQMPEDDVRSVRDQRAQYLAFDRGTLGLARAALDTWTAAFFWPLEDTEPPVPSTDTLALTGPQRPPSLAEEQWTTVEQLRKEHRFFHWPVEFPEVFERGGFDCVVGNVPWERIKLQEEEFFAERDPEIANAPNKAARERLIRVLATSETGRALFAEFEAAKRMADVQSKFVRASGRFPLTAVGDVNLYALFAEHHYSILNQRGRAGITLPTGIATDDSTKRFFQSLLNSESLVSLYSFFEIRQLFPDTDSRSPFCLITMSQQPVQSGDLAFSLASVEDLRDERRRFQLSTSDFALLNPNTNTCPIFRTSLDAELIKAIYRRVPVLSREIGDTNPWNAEFVAMFHMANDSELFQDVPGEGRVPLYEAKLFHQYNHRWATYEGKGVRDSMRSELADPHWMARPRYWVESGDLENRLRGRWKGTWLLGFRRIARATDERTLMVTVLPYSAAADPAMIIFVRRTNPAQLSAFLANLNSLVTDYVVRQKLSGTDIRNHYFKQFPILPPSAYELDDLRFIVRRVLELTYCSWDLKPFASDMGYNDSPFLWDEERRAVLRAELDAYYAALYGLNRDELRYILDPEEVYGPDFPGETFRVLKEREIKQIGEYRTRRLVLEAWDRLGLEPRNRDGRYEAR